MEKAPYMSLVIEFKPDPLMSATMLNLKRVSANYSLMLFTSNSIIFFCFIVKN